MANVCSPWKLIVIISYCNIFRAIDVSTIPCLEILIKPFCFKENREPKLSLFKKTAAGIRMRSTRANAWSRTCVVGPWNPRGGGIDYCSIYRLSTVPRALSFLLHKLSSWPRRQLYST